jgi:hypothetical protein
MRDKPEMREFVLSYQFEGGNWMVGIMAESPEDAARRVAAIRRSGVLIGSAERFTPVELEYRGERHTLNR